MAKPTSFKAASFNFGANVRPKGGKGKAAQKAARRANYEKAVTMGSIKGK